MGKACGEGAGWVSLGNSGVLEEWDGEGMGRVGALQGPRDYDVPQSKQRDVEKEHLGRKVEDGMSRDGSAGQSAGYSMGRE